MVVEIIPAIDLKNGRVVRLRQGLETEATSYPGDPVDVAREWKNQGARRLHVVNLDGAFGRVSQNAEVIRRICEAVRIPVQCGGGIRSLPEADRALAEGCEKVVVGTVAIENQDVLLAMIGKFGPSRVIVALDTKEGRVTTQGWTITTEHNVIEFTRRLRDAGVTEILHTNVMHDGMMVGPDTASLREIADTGLRVIASGGISSHDDVHKLIGLGIPNLSGIIIGKALYEQKIRLDLLLKELADAEA
jgi:phosphoribosylformimino-5-aminoimidazole carboxamide ribotide isomerase